MAKRRRKKKKTSLPQPLVTVIQKIEDFIDWIAPAAEWVGEKAEQIKAASDAVPPPSQKWVKNRRVDTRNATVTLFMLFLAVVAVLALNLSIRPTYSELEERELTKFPKPTVMEVLDGTFFNEINTWFADTFPYREKFLSVHRSIENWYGFRGVTISGVVEGGDEIPDAPDASQNGTAEQNTQAESSTVQTDTSAAQAEPEERPQDIDDGQDEQFTNVEKLDELLVNGNTAYEYYNFDKETADSYASVINRAAELLQGKAKVYDMVVPTSMYVCLTEKQRAKYNSTSSYDQKKAVSYIYQSMSEDVTTVDVVDTLLEHQQEREYLYFRTDHHWTALAAYYAYRQFAPTAGRTAASYKDSFDERIYEGFLGSFYRKKPNAAMEKTPDTVYAYAPKDASKMQIITSEGQNLTIDIVQDGERLSQNQKYLCFIGGDNPWSVIENENRKDGSSVLLVKESFGNCFAPFLVESYQYVYVVDYRYLSKVDDRKLAQLVEDYDIDDVLFLNNISATRESSLVQRIAGIVE